MPNDLGALDLTKPDGATQAVNVLDDYERETKATLVGWAGVEHDLKGRHKTPIGPGASRPLTTGATPAVDGTIYINSESGWIERFSSTYNLWMPISPIAEQVNYVFNGNFAKRNYRQTSKHLGWEGGPTGTSSITASTSGPIPPLGGAAVSMTRGDSDMSIFQQGHLIFHPVGWWKYKIVTMGCWVFVGPGGVQGEIGFTDGINAVTVLQGDTGGVYKWLQLPFQIQDPTTIKPVLSAKNGSGEVRFQGVRLSVGSFIGDYIPSMYDVNREFFLTGGDIYGASNLPAANGSFSYSIGASGTFPSGGFGTSLPKAVLFKGLQAFIGGGSPSGLYTFTLTSSFLFSGTLLSGSHSGPFYATDFNPDHHIALVPNDIVTVQMTRSGTGIGQSLVQISLLCETVPDGVVMS